MREPQKKEHQPGRTGSQPSSDEQLEFAAAEEILRKVREADKLRKMDLGVETNQQVVELLKQLTTTISTFSKEQRSRFPVPAFNRVDTSVFINNLDPNGAAVMVAEFGLRTRLLSGILDISGYGRQKQDNTALLSILNDIFSYELGYWNAWPIGRDARPANFSGLVFPRQKELMDCDAESHLQRHHLIQALGQLASSEVIFGEPRQDIKAFCRAFFIGKDVKSHNRFIDAARQSLTERGGYVLEEDTVDITKSFAAANKQINLFKEYPKLKIYQFTGVHYQ